MTERFLRNEMLLGPAAMEKLAGSHVCVVGLGGVGSWAAETLARAGVGELTLIDQDVYGESNINRQLGAVMSTVGRPKAEVMAARALDVNPDCRVHPIVGRYDRGDSERFWGRYDLVADCIDLVSCKVDLICQALERGIPIVSALGTGNKLDPSLLEVTDLAKTRGCPLARVMRRELGRRGVKHLRVVYSPEEPACCAPLEAPPPGRRSVPGSVPWVPPAAGVLLGGAAVMELIGGLIPEKEENKEERP
ncbi:MAG: tRNA threonylcarbamoyladenosine dehydratase [Oscillospiraceae bacterium]|jgi:tRNA A37 threonylcarbamoyladenosine dehydratase|nr:tRNA threonylcarbamoyladenosine dehydratase [Oscillospiraceae bacterium]MDE6899939.1 tRNA threonylcarbamoyladenosine dehydratase [Oscillospiraceae bacterium]